MGELLRALPLHHGFGSTIAQPRIVGAPERGRVLLQGSSSRRRRRLVTIKASGSDQDHDHLQGSLPPELRERWEASRGKLMELGLSIEDADRVIGKSSGHLKSPYWGEGKEKSVPAVEEVAGKVEYLKSLGLSDAEVSGLMKKFPEILGCKLEEEIQGNVGVLDVTWGISGRTLKSLVLRKPQVLGYNVDCKGDCMAECTRCWARF